LTGPLLQFEADDIRPKLAVQTFPAFWLVVSFTLEVTSTTPQKTTMQIVTLERILAAEQLALTQSFNPGFAKRIRVAKYGVPGRVR